MAAASTLEVNGHFVRVLTRLTNHLSQFVNHRRQSQRVRQYDQIRMRNILSTSTLSYFFGVIVSDPDSFFPVLLLVSSQVPTTPTPRKFMALSFLQGSTT